MGRFHVEADFGTSLYLSRWWFVRWELIGNLGVDFVVPLARLIGIEAATHIAVGAIPALTALNFILND